MDFSIPPKNSNPQKYKTTLCKHFSTPKGCLFGDKCLFAHGIEDLKGVSNQMNIQNNQAPPQKPNNKLLNAQNYKIVKCKYFEKDGTCRYGSLCTFAHGDKDLKTKSENMNSLPNRMMNYPRINHEMNQMFPNRQNFYLMNYPNIMMTQFGFMGYPNQMMFNNGYGGKNIRTNNFNNKNNSKFNNTNSNANAGASSNVAGATTNTNTNTNAGSDKKEEKPEEKEKEKENENETKEKIDDKTNN